MKKYILILLLTLNSLSVFAQSYPFTQREGVKYITYDMSSYAETEFYQVKIRGYKILSDSRVIDDLFFLEVKDIYGTEDISRLAEKIISEGINAQVNGTILVVLADDTIIELQNHNMQAKSRQCVSFNLTMSHADFNKLMKSNIVGLITSGQYLICVAAE